MMDYNILQAYLDSDIPLLLWGAPGTGKTAWITQQAQRRGAHLETLIGSTLDPTEVCGYPVPRDGKLIFYPPEWAVRIREKIQSGQQAWLFLDELSCAPPSVQAALLRIVHQRIVGEIDLSGCRIMAAANRAEHAADNGVLSAATANRWAHVDWTPRLDKWIAGELSGWGTPRTMAEGDAASKICAFLRRSSPEYWLNPPNDLEAAGESWPSPRSWSMGIKIIAQMPAQEWGNGLRACVGDAAATAAITYINALDLPSPQDILAGAKLPSRGDQLYAALSALATYVTALNPTQKIKNIKNAWHILGQVRPDIAIIPAQVLLAAAPDIAPPEALKLGNRIIGVKNDNH